MPHIHTTPGQIDFTVDVFVVHPPTKRALLRLHDKLHRWLVPGGHIELNETPVEAALREVKEEVGLDITLFGARRPFDHLTERYEELIPPEYMNVHFITPEHRHMSLVYFATSGTTNVVEPDNHERSGGCIWLTAEEVEAHPDVDKTVKWYATKALEVLAG